MKRKEVRFRLSPNEEAQLIKEEQERRRKLRLQQVREQQRYIAQRVRGKVEQRRQHELEQLEEELRAEWEQQQTERVNNLQRLYQESLSLVGQGHRSAKENETDLRAFAQKEDNDAKAEERFLKALKEVKLQRLKNHENQMLSIDARKKALQVEKLRSAKVASLPLPPFQPHQNADSKQHIVKKCDTSAFAATHYHMPETMVDKERDTSQPSACVEAELEVERLQVLQRKEEQKKEEQQEKAQLRGKQALKREQLLQDHGRLLVELEHMQQTDLWRRRQKVSDMPRQIFEPLYKRKETQEDLQRDMEFAFEDMYTGERRVKGDLLFQLVPEPLPSPSTDGHDHDLDVTQDDLTAQSEHYDAEHEVKKQRTKSINPELVDGRPAPRRGLKKLLDRIQTQRHQWSQHDATAASPSNSSEPPPNEAAASPLIRTEPPPEEAAPSAPIRTEPVPPSNSTDSPPEQDSSLDTGPLRSEKPSTSAQADLELSNVLAKRIQEFEEQQKKKEEELEREKRAQIDYLQQLEEQRLKLEQRLIEAQQERDLMTSARPTSPTDPPVQDNNRPLPFVGDHTRRMEQHRLQLLQQNETHQKSVAVARQRLEEYQRALRIRYNLPPVPPQSITDSIVSSAAQVLPSRPVGAQEKTQASVEASNRDLYQNPAFHPPRFETGFDTTLPVQVRKSSDFSTVQIQRLLLQLTQNRRRDHLQTDVSSTNPSICSSSDPSPSSSLGAGPEDSTGVDPSSSTYMGVYSGPTGIEPNPVVSMGVRPGPAVTLGVHPSSAVTMGVRPGPAVTMGVHPGSAVTMGVHPSPSVSLGVGPVPSVSVGVCPVPSVSVGVCPVPSVSVGVCPIPSVSVGVCPIPSVSVGVGPVPSVSLGVGPGQAVSLGVGPIPSVSLGVGPGKGVSLGVGPGKAVSREEATGASLFRRIEEGMDTFRVQDFQSQAEIVKSQLEEEGVSLDEHQQRQEELDRIEQQNSSWSALDAQASQDRSILLKSLLKAVEKSKGGALHLENSQHEPSNSGSIKQRSLFPVHPPVSRAGLHSMETAPHQLSMIEEVQTPASLSLLTGEELMTVEYPHELSVVTAGIVHTDSGASPGSSPSDLAHNIFSPLSTDSGRGADYSGPGITSSKYPLECAPKPHDCLSSTISTGSYISTDSELQSQPGSGSSPFHQNSQSSEGVSLDKVNALRTPKLEPVNSTLETPPAEEQGQDSFRPLVGQLAEQSSCMADEPAIEQLVGHPSAHSSVIEPLPGAVPSRLDGSVSHWRDGLTDAPTSLWPSAGHGLEQSTVCAGSHEDESSAEPDTSSGFSALDSFHPLPAEVTNNQNDNTANFEIPGHTEPLSIDSEDSIEQMRAEEVSSSSLFQELLQPLSQCSPHEGPISIQLVVEKGILEQSEITLESLTDSSLLTQESGATDDPRAQCIETSTTSELTSVTGKMENLWTCTVNDFGDKKLCTPKPRHRSEMKRRTQRLYEQLEEVRHQRELRNRQETSAQNRLKAQAFHQKTLLRLRAKQAQS